MTVFAIRHLCRGAARIPMPGHSIAVKEEPWYGHPLIIFFLLFLVIISIFTMLINTKTILEPKTQTIVIRPVKPEPEPKPVEKTVVKEIIRRVVAWKKKPRIVKPKKIPQKKITPKKTLPKKIEPKKIKSKKIIPKEFKQKEIKPKQINVSELTPKKMNHKKVQKKTITPKKIVPKNVVKNKITSHKNEKKLTTNRQITPKQITTSNIEPTKITQNKEIVRRTPDTKFIPQVKAPDFTPSTRQSLPTKESGNKLDKRNSGILLSDKSPQFDVSTLPDQQPLPSANQESKRSPMREEAFAARDITMEITDTDTPAALPVNSSEQYYEEENVVITGRIIGKSDRVANLIKEIYAKAILMDPRLGPYCCTINNFKCIILIEGNIKKKVNVKFDPLDVPFEVVSKLERMLPKRLSTCTK